MAVINNLPQKCFRFCLFALCSVGLDSYQCQFVTNILQFCETGSDADIVLGISAAERMIAHNISVRLSLDFYKVRLARGTCFTLS